MSHIKLPKLEGPGGTGISVFVNTEDHKVVLSIYAGNSEYPTWSATLATDHPSPDILDDLITELMYAREVLKNGGQV